MSAIDFQYDDGGRRNAGYRGSAGDCAVRAVAIATEKPYQEVYDSMNDLGKREHITRKKRGKSSAREGVYRQTLHKYMASIGWRWVPTMYIGSGCKVHVDRDELPMGRLVLSLSRHICACIDRVIHDTFDPSRFGTRCVYGYFIKD